MKKIIVRTKMTEIPTSCRECSLHVYMWHNIGCAILRDWIEPMEFREGKRKLEGCPLEEE